MCSPTGFHSGLGLQRRVPADIWALAHVRAPLPTNAEAVDSCLVRGGHSAPWRHENMPVSSGPPHAQAAAAHRDASHDTASPRCGARDDAHRVVGCIGIPRDHGWTCCTDPMALQARGQHPGVMSVSAGLPRTEWFANGAVHYRDNFSSLLGASLRSGRPLARCSVAHESVIASQTFAIAHSETNARHA